MIDRKHTLEVPAKHGTFTIPRHDLYVGPQLIQYGEYSEGEIMLLAKVLKFDDWVIEGGSNFGALSVPLANLVPEGKIFLFEPQEAMFELLQENLKRNTRTNWIAEQAALYHIPCTLNLTETDISQLQNYGSCSVSPFNFGKACKAITIDSLKLTRCNLIKLDVEGSERSALIGGQETIAKFRPFLYMENDRSDKHGELMQLLSDWGYVAYWDVVPFMNPNNWLKNNNSIHPGICSINVLAVPNEKQSPLSDKCLVRYTKGSLPEDFENWNMWKRAPCAW